MNFIIHAIKNNDIIEVENLIKSQRKLNFQNESSKLNQKATKKTDLMSGLDFSMINNNLPPSEKQHWTNADVVPQNVESILDNVVQLTSINDEIHAEAIVFSGKYEVVLDLLLINRLPHSVYNLTFAFIFSEGMVIDFLPTIHMIGSAQTKSVKLRFRLGNSDSNIISISM
ncbi:MAG: coatomer subunit beta, partial [Paramarteilia canceri]